MNIELLNIKNMTFYDLIEIKFISSDSISFIFYTHYPYKETPPGYYILEIKNIFSLKMINNDPDKLDSEKNTPFDLSIQEVFVNNHQFYNINIFANQEFAITAEDVNCYCIKNIKTQEHYYLSEKFIKYNKVLDINSFNLSSFQVEKIIFDEIYNAQIKLRTDNSDSHYFLEIDSIIEIKINNLISNNKNNNFSEKLNMNKITYIKQHHDTFYNRFFCQKNIYYLIEFNFDLNKNISFIAKKFNFYTKI